MKSKHSKQSPAITKENAVNAKSIKLAHVWCDLGPTVSADQCKLCCHFDQQCNSGKPNKRK